LTIEFGPLTLLSGLNGQGKSTVLQALLLLRQSYQQALLPNIGLALNGDLIRIGTARDAFFEYAKSTQIGFELHWADGSKGNWLFEYDDEVDVLDLASPPVELDNFKTSLFNDDFQYLQAERLGPRVSSEISDFQVRQHRWLGTRGEYTINFLSVFEGEKIAHHALGHEKAILPDLKYQVEAWLSEVSPGTRLELSPFRGIDQISLRYSFETGRFTSNAYRSTNVGFGISYTLPILVALLSAKPGALILVENPEAHLHPKGQVQMGELIARAASCGIQVVVETHSDHLLNGIRIAVHEDRLTPDKVQIHFFERREQDGLAAQSEVISPRIDRDGRIDQWPDGFFDEWDKSLETLLMPKDA
jgi:predicted ATPase